MFDFIRRALKNPWDYWTVLTWQRVSLVRHEEHGEGVHSFVFKKPKQLTWKAGQHGVWWFFDWRLKGKNWRAFSVASSAHENELRISTNISPAPSAFKQKLLALKPGDTIWLQGPFGEFHADDHAQLIGIAGGIGITPFRALAYEIANGHNDTTALDLIYSAHEVYTFKREFDVWTSKSSKIRVSYVHTPDEVELSLHQHVATHGKETPVLLSGSPGMITALTKSCYEQGLKNVVSDPFKGY